MRILTGIAWLWLLLGLGSCGGGDSGSAAYETRYEVIIESAAARQLSRGMIWLALPTVSSADVDVRAADDARLIADNLGNRQLAFELDEVPVGYERALSIVVNLPPQTEQLNASSELPGGAFSSAEALIEIDDPKLQEKGQSLRAFNTQQTISAIREFVATLRPSEAPAADESAESPALPPGEPDEKLQRGALYAFESGEGDAVDQVLLTVALLRAASVPARVVAGFLDDGDGVLASNEMHVWAEYLEQESWQPLLPFGADEQTHAIVFRVFSRAENLASDSLIQNFFQGVGLRIRGV
jgi:hypothetical protein